MTLEPDSAHLRHDPLLIAGHASSDLAPADAERVERWLRDCDACATLHADLLALSTALSTLPKTATAPRDFRLSPAHAARLRGGPWWRRVARAIAAPRGIGRPLATAFTTLGLVGLLIGSLPAGLLPSAATTGEHTLSGQTSNDAAGGPSPGATQDDVSVPLGPAAEGGDGRGSAFEGYVRTPDVMKDDGATSRPVTLSPGPGRAEPASPSLSPVIGLAIAFLALGIGLFGIRRFGRRLA